MKKTKRSTAGLPFAALRVIADPAQRHVPPSAMRGMREDGRTDAIALLRALARRPRDIAGLVGIARDAWTARLKRHQRLAERASYNGEPAAPGVSSLDALQRVAANRP